MGKNFFRVDDRLIHGQIVTAWCSALGISEIVAIDDRLAINPALQKMMLIGIPKNYKAHVVTSDEAKKLVTENSEGNRLFVSRHPQDLAKFREELKSFEYVILGNAAKTPSSKRNLYKDGGALFWIDGEDEKLFNELTESGIKLILQVVPNKPAHAWPIK